MRPPSPIVEMPITYEDDISAEDSVSVCQLPTTSPPREKQPPPQPADLRALKPSPPKPIPQEPEFPILVETPIPVEPKPVELPKVEEPKPVEPPKVEEPKPVEPPKVEQDSAIEFTGNDRERPIFDVLVELIEELKLDPTNRPILLHMFARRIYRIKTA
jgi:outer membrane biosynthesis protein TonB